MSTRKSDLVLEIDFDNHDEQDEVIKSNNTAHQKSKANDERMFMVDNQ